MFGENPTTVDDLRNAPDEDRASLAFVSDSVLVKAFAEPVMRGIQKGRSLAELLCRMLDNPEKARTIARELPDVFRMQGEDLVTWANNMLREEAEILHNGRFDERKLTRFCREFLDMLCAEDYFDDLMSAFRSRWSYDGFIPIEVKGLDVAAALVPFRFEDNCDRPLAVRFQSSNGVRSQIHEEWTRGIQEMAGANGMHGVDIVLAINPCDIGYNSYQLSVLMAWWNRQCKLVMQYNRLRVFATGEIDRGMLKPVAVAIKRKKIRDDVAQALLISPSFNGEFGEIGDAEEKGYEGIRKKIVEILLECNADDFFCDELSIWQSTRMAERVVGIEPRLLDEGGKCWIHFARCAGGLANGGRFDGGALVLLGAICSMMNSPNGGVIVVGLEKSDDVVRPVGISEVLPRDEDGVDLLSYYTDAGWCMDKIAASVSDALGRNAAEGWNVERNGLSKTWRIVDESGKAEDLRGNVRVEGGEFENRPVVLLSIRPKEGPMAIRCVVKIASQDIQVDYVCGGRNSSPGFPCRVWGIGELALAWPRPKIPESLQFRNLLERERGVARRVRDDIYSDYEKIRCIMTRMMAIRSGYDYPPILDCGAEDRLRTLFAKNACWQVASKDLGALRRVFAVLALGYLCAHKCDERIFTLPIAISAQEASRSGNLLGCVLNELHAAVPKLAMGYGVFVDALRKGRFRLLLDLSDLADKQIYELDVVGTVRNISQHSSGQLAVFGPSDWMAMPELQDVSMSDLEVVASGLFK